METLAGQITDIRGPYRDNWCILTVKPEGNKSSDLINVTGSLANFQPGDVCTFEGRWKTSQKYGKQFAAEVAVLTVPRDKDGMRLYLTRSFKWIGPVLAGKLIEVYGENLFSIIENSPESLTKVNGITPDRAKEIHEEYLKVKEDRSYDLWFAKVGLTLNMQNRLIERYGSKEDAIERIKANPYLLADEVFGVGFKKADVIGLSIGIARDSAVRIGACLRFLLKEATSEGHCYLPQHELIKKCMEYVSCDEEKVHQAITDSLRSEKVIYHEEQLYPAALYRAETEIARKLRSLVAAPHALIMSELTRDEIKELDEDQQAALAMALKSKILVVTGGPGVGKTFTTNMIIRALGDRKIELACPTGKAAKRLAEMSGRTARTIHRLLEFSPMEGGFQRDSDNPLTCDTLIIDETSMVDIPLMHSLLDAITLDTQIVFVGDGQQLPSVGAGRVLGDMIESKVIPVAHLQRLHRQAAKSKINLNARKVNARQKLIAGDFNRPDDPDGDFWFVPEEDADAIPNLIIKIIQAIPKKFEHSWDDIQVLCPQKKGPIGTQNLNKVLQPVLNPTGGKLPGVSFCAGDRVIQTKNNYKLAIFNGDIGTVTGADKENLFVEFEDLKGKREVSYPIEEVSNLYLAYALTIHKYQGSETPVVIMPVHTQNYIMLKNNLLYTGITRAKKLIVLVGMLKAVNIAIRTEDSSVRYTNLKKWLIDGVQNDSCE
ncbi:MAG: ATP-dependent RecD-like DNA helicase [Syntrophobacteraceae bacterium]